MASQNSVIRARIDEASKVQAAAVLAEIGLSLSDAIRLMVRRIVSEKALPFEPLVPNAETIAAMEAAERGEVFPFTSFADMLKEPDETTR